MKHIPILLLALFLMACGNKSQHELPPSDVEEGWGERYQRELDSIRKVKAEVPDEELPSKSYMPSSHSSGSYSSSRDDDDYDNMRGWDPASEDDMEDNGMSRYMENYDEEGWD